MVKYIKKADGKMAGSIGDGRDSVPTVAAQLRELTDRADRNALGPTDLSAALATLRTNHPEFLERTTVTFEGSTLPITVAQLEKLRPNPEHLSVDTEGNLTAVYRDEDSENPRDWDNISLFTGKGKYLTDETGLREQLQRNDDYDFASALAKKYGNNAVLVPIWVADHSGVSYSPGSPVRLSDVATGDEGEGLWDEVTPDFAVVTEESVLENYGDTSDLSWGLATVEASNEVRTYNQWANGEVYYTERIGPDGEPDDACGGFYSIDEAINEVA
jgi:hypothetical protein